METKNETWEASFKLWLAKVDAEVQRRTGLSYMDLPDIDYAGLFEEGVGAKRAAGKAIKGARE